ncbi:hypothetical protein AA0311_2583 [Asaia bogorensis NBRC 16594]|uniref:Uncharacterized protein n=1 Tax=Asaia bogorensis NBRC 16594 TaxID=1231624 RepID=A0AAN4R5M5_9PROT|nr:hypothetical protein AA0311_2583 [Asaia bogorensis NBRC 16594]GEL54907.1 hypothetical protein ABO01nite_29140 [Asaia bogorensis NBRC 16594]
MPDKQTTGKPLSWFLPFATLAVIAVFIPILPTMWQSSNIISSLPIAAAIMGALSAFFWIISAYVPDVDARWLNAIAGGYSGTSVVLGAGALPNMPSWWPITAYFAGILLFLITSATTIPWKRLATTFPWKTGKNTHTTAGSLPQPDITEVTADTAVAEGEPPK